MMRYAPRRRYRNRRGPWRGLLAGLLLALPATGQPPDSELPVDGELFAARVIHLEVVVSERGKRVSGLGAEEFRLLVDGREVPIEEFTEVDEGRVVAASGAADRAPVTGWKPGERVGTYYLVFIDDFFGIAVYRNRILRILSDQLALLGPEDRLAIVAFDGRKVEVLSDWARSPVQLGAVFDRAMERTAQGLRRFGNQPGVLATSTSPPRTTTGSGFSNIGFAGARRSASPLGMNASPSSRGLPRQLELVVEAAAVSLRAFADAPGRPVALLIADGWPAVVEMVPSRMRVFTPLINAANLLGFTLYPVDYQGGSEEFLTFLAEATGGRAFFGNAARSVLEHAAEDTRSYYRLGFTPIWEGGDASHRIKVELRRRGLKARARTTFPDPSPQSEALLVDRVELDGFPLPDGRSSVATPDDSHSRR